MKSFKSALLVGFLVWLVPFGVAVLIFPLRATERPLFESIMPVVVTLITVLSAHRYLAKVDRSFLKEGVYLGLLWFPLSMGIDLLMVSQGPMKMTLVDYLKDIGLTYLIIPTITVGSGYLLEGRKP